MKRKSEATKLTAELITEFMNQHNTQIKCFQFDNSGEFINKDMKKLLKSKGIIMETSAPYTPWALLTMALQSEETASLSK
jgi:hypothetical protein